MFPFSISVATFRWFKSSPSVDFQEVEAFELKPNHPTTQAPNMFMYVQLTAFPGFAAEFDFFQH